MPPTPPPVIVHYGAKEGDTVKCTSRLAGFVMHSWGCHWDNMGGWGWYLRTCTASGEDYYYDHALERMIPVDPTALPETTIPDLFFYNHSSGDLQPECFAATWMLNQFDYWYTPYEVWVADPHQKPVALFTFTPTTTQIVPSTITFIDGSAREPESWYWDFGDGDTSIEQNPVHTYLTAGTFTVSLTVTNYDGTTTVTHPVTVSAQSAAFTGTPRTFTTKGTTVFTNTSSLNPTVLHTYLWTFGDGYTSTLIHPTHLYQPVPHNFAAQIKYSVTLTVTNIAGSVSYTATNYITLNPGIANFSATPLAQTLPQYTQFSNASTCYPTEFLWDFGDGATSDLSYPVHQYPGIGTYTVSLLVHDSDGYEWFIERVGYIVISSTNAILFPPNEGVSAVFPTTVPAVGSKGLLLPDGTYMSESTFILVGHKVLMVPDKNGQLMVSKPLALTTPVPPTPAISITTVTPSSVSKDAGDVEFIVIGTRFDVSPILPENAILSLLTKSIEADYVAVEYYNELHIGFHVGGFTAGSATLTLTNEVGTTTHTHITLT